ncbi:hypothetical protein TNCV_3214061 [Trichonephila clavipes]|nr:hypothetical protein TNCV_3214061 [Trichonephila clavipes]
MATLITCTDLDAHPTTPSFGMIWKLDCHLKFGLDNIVFSDESRFNLSSDDNRVRVCRRRGGRLNPAFSLQQHITPTAGVMLFENKSDGVSCLDSNLDSDEDIMLSENDCEESEENADGIDNIPVNSGIYVSGDITD